jgi:hypothetical protein
MVPGGTVPDLASQSLSVIIHIFFYESGSNRILGIEMEINKVLSFIFMINSVRQPIRYYGIVLHTVGTVLVGIFNGLIHTIYAQCIIFYFSSGRDTCIVLTPNQT